MELLDGWARRGRTTGRGRMTPPHLAAPGTCAACYWPDYRVDRDDPPPLGRTWYMRSVLLASFASSSSSMDFLLLEPVGRERNVGAGGRTVGGRNGPAMIISTSRHRHSASWLPAGAEGAAGCAAAPDGCDSNPSRLRLCRKKSAPNAARTDGLQGSAYMSVLAAAAATDTSAAPQGSCRLLSCPSEPTVTGRLTPRVGQSMYLPAVGEAVGHTLFSGER